MDDLKKFAAGASAVFNRAVQYTEEKLGTSDRTELDAHLENLFLRAERTKQWTEKILRQTELVLQPNPTVRVEDFFYDKLDKKKKERQSSHEALGQLMVDAGSDFGSTTPYGNALIKCGAAEQKLGQSEKDFVHKTAEEFLTPLKAFLEGDMKTIVKEKRILEVKRLDLDAAKSKLKKAKSVKGKDDKKFTPEAIQDAIEKSEAELRVSQNEFDRQCEITKLLLEGINSAHIHHLRCLNDFIEAQVAYYSQCQQSMTELQRQLGSHMSSVGIAPSSSVGNGGAALLSGVQTPLLQAGPGAGSSTSPLKAKVLYDYDAADSTELSLAADELITVYRISSTEEDWMMGERGLQRGKVPLTYLEILKS